MQIPLQVSFRNIDHSDAIEAYAAEQAAKLETFYPRLIGCRVVIEAPHARHHKGRVYHVRVDLTVPGEEIVVRRDPAEHAAHTDLHVAIRDAFHAAQRHLQDYVRRHQPQAAKSRVEPPHARVVRLLPDRDCGFLVTDDGREIYFHRNAVVGGAYERLEIGTEVRFMESQGDEGPQASTVTVVGKEGRHHPVPPG
jgi:cold shock CspA family protein/ribosome-associated translation inhibitor RaiA